MDFYGHQDQARRKTFWYVILFVLSAVVVVAAVDVAAWAILGIARGGEMPQSISDALPLLSVVTIGVFALVVGGSLVKTAQLAHGGGRAIASALGGKLVSPGEASVGDRRLLNVVEEMAIASSLPVPQVYVLEGQPSINAFAAGMTPGDAVVGVTRGTVDRLSRDELQGVIAHEFSHILNGDMRLNLRLVGLVHGLLLMAIAGRVILGLLRHVRGGGKKGGGALLVIALSGVALLVLGGIGYALGRLLQAATSRQREYLADASAVQFTRNPEGLAGALRKLLRHGSRVKSEHTAEMSHLFFAKALGGLATHPPLEARLDRLDPGWRDRVDREPRAAEEAPRSERAAPTPASVPAGAVSGLVGRLESADPARGEEVIHSLPEAVLEACRDPFSARAAVLAAVADPRPEQASMGWAALARTVEASLLEETERLHPAVAPLGPDATLSVVLLALPALRQMSVAQVDDFLGALRTLVASDGVVTLQEHAIAELAALHMGAWPSVSGSPPDDRLTAAAVELLGVLARSGTREPVRAAKAFQLGCRELGVVRALPAEREAAWDTFHHALEVLRSSRVGQRRRIVSAAAWTASEDGVLNPTESALLRLVADALECPLPLLGASPAS